MKEALKLALELAIMHHSDDGYAELRSKVRQLAKEALAQPEQEPCGGCGGSGWVPRDPDIGTDQECFVCNGSGAQSEQEPDDLTIAYMSGFHDGKKKRPWVGLTATAKLDLLSTAKGAGGRINGDAQLLELLTDHETQLKRKNT